MKHHLSVVGAVEPVAAAKRSRRAWLGPLFLFLVVVGLGAPLLWPSKKAVPKTEPVVIVPIFIVVVR